MCVAGVVSLWRAQRVHGWSRALVGCLATLLVSAFVATEVSAAFSWIAGVGTVLLVFAGSALALRVLPFDLGVQDAEFRR